MVLRLLFLILLIQPARLLAEEPKAQRAILISIDCLSAREFEEVIAPDSGWKVPSLRRLVKDSVNYRFAHSHAPWTTPSHVSMLSGLYPAQHGWNLPYQAMFVEGRTSFRKGDFKTLADYARAASMRTFAETGIGSISARFGNGQGFETYKEHTPGKPPKVPGMLRAEARQVGAAMARQIRSRGRERYFAFAHTYDFHQGPGDRIAEAASVVRADRSHLKMLEWIDREFLAPMLTALDAQKAYRETIIVLTADHGSNILRLDRKLIFRGLGHYEENLHVPLVVKYPGGRRAGETVRASVRHIDLLPTIAAALNLKTPGYQGDGVRLQDLPVGAAASFEAGPGRDEIGLSWSETDGHTFPRQAIVFNRYKYIRMSEDPRVLGYLLKPTYARTLGDTAFLRRHFDFPPRDEELYDLAADPFEIRNLNRDSGSAGVLTRARSLMARLVSRFPRPDPNRDRVEKVDPATLEALRALGYVR